MTRRWVAWSAVLVGLVFLTGLALWLWPPQPTPAPAQDGGALFTVKTAFVTETPDDGPAVDKTIALPHAWDKTYPGRGGQATYVLQLPARPAGADHALYFPRVGNQVEARLGEQVLIPLESPRNPARDRAKAPLMVPIAADNPAQTLTLSVWTQAGRWGGLASVTVGPRIDIERLYHQRYVSRQYGALAVTVGMLLASLVAAALWWVQREPVYGVFAWASLCGALRFADRLIEFPPLPWPLWGAVNALALAWFVLGMCRFCLLMTGHPMRHTYRITWALLGIEALLVGISFFGSLPAVWTVALALLAVPSLVVLGLLVQVAWVQRSRDAGVIAASIAVVVVAGLRDLWSVRMAHAGMDYFSVLPHASLLFVLMLGWLVVDRYARNARAHRELLVALDAKVRQREHELRETHARLNEETVAQATLIERQRIMRDIHDGVGAQLVGLLSLLNRDGASRETLQEHAHAALDELRMAVDALQPVHGDLATVLATLRYRLQPRLEAAGIAVQWQVDALPPVDGLTPRVVLQLQRILLEAFTNVIRHARASQLTVTAHAGPLPPSATPGATKLVLQVSDNGQGFDAQTPRAGGQGLSGMQARATAIGATLRVSSAVADGTCVRLEMSM